MPTATEITPLTDLAVGDKIVLKRNLNHPVHMKQVACDPRNGSSTMFVRDPDVEELLGTTTIIERRSIPAIPGVGLWGSREEKTLVRLANGFWYDCATGLQYGSGATLIERV
ncbi:hypothetical protein [Psychromicrobium sp. YIM B11713]|uniref:hypothetical protein n=1 Tax=Psychromicrobium sp. YIM B11713 TaxID=3145233 RepID=UPI00374FABBD